MREAFTARPYQDLIVAHQLEHNRCSIYASMGTGKTVATLTTLQCLYDTGIARRPTLILAPLRVARSVWPAEAQKWAHLDLDVVPILGTAIERAAALKRPAALYSINYDNLPWLIEHCGKDWPFEGIVADESTRLKGHRLNSGGKRAKALSSVAHLPRVKRWINLTGTPAPNGLIDLWGQQWFVDQGLALGRTFTAFKDRWFYPHPSGYGTIPHKFANEQIHGRLKDSTITISAKDWFNVAEPIVRDIYVDLPLPAWKLYKQMEREMFVQIEGAEVEAFNSASMTIKCLQIANGALYHDPETKAFKQVHDEKLDALASVIEEAAGMPVLVAYQFKSDLIRLKKRFPHGRELDQRSSTEHDWNTGKIPILFAHPASAGHGLNLQHGGNILAFFGHWWDLEQYQQIIERIGPVRQLQSGYDRPVFIYHIYARGTVDEIVSERRVSKAGVQDLLLQAMRRTV